jgi:hypothetical protein
LARTIKDFVVSGRGHDDVNAFVLNWLKQNDFTLLEFQSDGSEKRYPCGGMHLILHPTRGNLLAVSAKSTGLAVAFEMTLHPSGQDWVVHLEGYATGSGPGFHGREWPFANETFVVAGAARKRGNELLTRFDSALAALSVPKFPTSPIPLATQPPASATPVTSGPVDLPFTIDKSGTLPTRSWNALLAIVDPNEAAMLTAKSRTALRVSIASLILILAAFAILLLTIGGNIRGTLAVAFFGVMLATLLAGGVCMFLAKSMNIGTSKMAKDRAMHRHPEFFTSEGQLNEQGWIFVKGREALSPGSSQVISPRSPSDNR